MFSKNLRFIAYKDLDTEKNEYEIKHPVEVLVRLAIPCDQFKILAPATGISDRDK